jgi:hypothetical protein
MWKFKKKKDYSLENAFVNGQILAEIANIQGLCETILEVLPDGKMDGTKALLKANQEKARLRIESLLLSSANRAKIPE